MDATIIRYVERLNECSKLIVNDENLNAIEKLIQFSDINAITKTDTELRIFFETVHPGNADMKLKRVIHHIITVPPLLAQIIEQGIEEKVMYTKNPLEVAEVIITSVRVLYEGLIEYEPEVLRKKIIAFVDIMESLLTIKKGTLAPMEEFLLDLSTTLRM